MSRVHRCSMDPAKSSSKSVVSYQLLALCLILVCFDLHAGMQVSNLRSLNQVNRELSFISIVLNFGVL